LQEKKSGVETKTGGAPGIYRVSPEAGRFAKPA
jgi:hypothetical protein